MTLHSKTCSIKYIESKPITLYEKTCLSVCRRRQCPIEQGDLLEIDRGDPVSTEAQKHRLGLCSMIKTSKFLQNAKAPPLHNSKASTLMWRSARCKRAVNSTLAGETIAMSAALADAEWAQIMIQDILDQTVTVRDTTGGTLPFQVVLRNNCTLSKRLPHEHSIDAKSVFDALIKECAGSRQDRRTAVDLAIVRETFKAQGSHISWIPPSAGNDALRHLPRNGKLVWDEETIRRSARLGRTKAVSRRQLETNGETLHGT